MDVLIIGSGGREHALAWAVRGSARAGRVYVAPGNGGTAAMDGVDNLALSGNDGIVAAARDLGVGLVIVGPEAPLAEGLGDALRAVGIPCFGPGRAGAEIEASKAFAKDFMVRHGIPTARHATFNSLEAAQAYVRGVDHPVVVKASGLAAGKGVLLPETIEEALAALDSLMGEGAFGEAGRTVVVEERLTGPEVSVLALTDGKHVRLLPPAQDHKRALDGDRGPNTGGMGAYAPAPVLDADGLLAIGEQVIRRAVDGLAIEKRPYRGVLYAGLMLTPDGPRCLEFNCRFGDPETQVLLPLLAEDPLDLMLAAATGTLSEGVVRTHGGFACTVVAASAGYPGAYEKGAVISGTDEAARLDETWVFHAGTDLVAGGASGHPQAAAPAKGPGGPPSGASRLVTSGGRVLAVTGLGVTLRQAVERAYTGQRHITFEGKHLRTDIARRALEGAL